MVAGTTALVGIIGNPVSHSLSPAMHNAAFQALGLDWAYVPLRVDPERLGAGLEGLLALGFRGANVTIPHKERVLDLLDEVSAHARAIGAVNTISIVDGKTIGDNTDWTGFLQDIRGGGFHPEGVAALVLGSGGSARAVAYALAGTAGRVVISSRNHAKGQALVSDLQRMYPATEVHFVPLESLGGLGDRVDLVVNTTPLGMPPLADASPWPSGVPFPRCQLVYDLVYSPPKTRLMEQAAAGGIRAANGLGMLVHQAVGSFRIWTGLEPPIDVMRGAADRSLTSSNSSTIRMKGRDREC